MRTLLLVSICLILSSCATSGDGRFRTQHPRNQSTSLLCIGYLSYPSDNEYQSTRKAELARRGEDCSEYHEAADTLQRTPRKVARAEERARSAHPQAETLTDEQFDELTPKKIARAQERARNAHQFDWPTPGQQAPDPPSASP